jgi:acetyl esterase/lipase
MFRWLLVSACPTLGLALQSFSTTYSIDAASDGRWAEGDGQIEGFFPDGEGPFPLFLWMPGTMLLPSLPDSQYMTQQMATRGYAAVAVQYPQYWSFPKESEDFEVKARAVAGPNPHTALSIMCANSKVDCSAGVATAGYSQGTHLAVLAAVYSSQVTAAYMVEGARPWTDGAWTICDDATIGHNISRTKRRYITGECDEYYARPTNWSTSQPSRAAAEDNLKKASGYDCGSETNCLQADGSGYRVTTTSDTDGSGCPNHENWSVKGASPPLAAWFIPLNDASLDWLAQAARRTQELQRFLLI